MLHSALLRVESVGRALVLISRKLLFFPSLYKYPDIVVVCQFVLMSFMRYKAVKLCNLDCTFSEALKEGLHWKF